jgi:hypothetical protein
VAAQHDHPAHYVRMTTQVTKRERLAGSDLVHGGPDRAAAIRLMAAVLAEQHDEMLGHPSLHGRRAHHRY